MDLNSSGDSWDADSAGSDVGSSPERPGGSSPETESPRKGRGKGRRRKGPRRSMSPIVPLSDPQEGNIVWAKVKNHRWWPAMLVNKEDCGQLAFDGRTRSCNFVFWFGDERVSPIAMSNLVDFKKGYHRFITPPGSKSFKSGVYLAIKELRKSFLLDTDDFDVPKALTWAEDGFPLPDEYCDTRTPDKVSDHVQNKLKVLSEKFKENGDENDEENKPEDPEEEEEEKEIKLSPEDVEMMNSIREGIIDLDDVCIACLSQNDQLQDHPFFNGSICNLCMEKMLDCSFSIGLDMIAFHCSICMNSGDMMVCSQPYCYRAFCYKCIVLKATIGVLDCIREADPWLCFMCTPFTSEMHGLLHPRGLWKENMWRAFHATNVKENVLKDISLRILCLDGSCDKVLPILSCLRKMGATIDTLYLCDIKDSELKKLDPVVGCCTHPTKPSTQIEKYEELFTIAPIHILIASPEDGEEESFGSKFFSFHNILSMLNILNQLGDHPPAPLMWIFQMIPPFWEDYVILITRYLQFHPAVWSKKEIQRKDDHLVWTNIPAMWAYLNDAKTLLEKYQPEPRNKKLRKIDYD